MTCCVIALAMVYQLIAAVRWVRGFLGFGTTPAAAGHRRLRQRLAGYLRRPWIRITFVSLLAIESAAAGTLAYEHRFHISNELAAVVFSMTGYARALCQSD